MINLVFRNYPLENGKGSSLVPRAFPLKMGGAGDNWRQKFDPLAPPIFLKKKP